LSKYAQITALFLMKW